MNLLNFIDCQILDNSNGDDFEIINLHTKNEQKAIKQCLEFFATFYYSKSSYMFYTNSTPYNFYCGWEFALKKSATSTYYLILNNKGNYFGL